MAENTEPDDTIDQRRFAALDAILSQLISERSLAVVLERLKIVSQTNPREMARQADIKEAQDRLSRQTAPLPQKTETAEDRLAKAKRLLSGEEE